MLLNLEAEKSQNHENLETVTQKLLKTQSNPFEIVYAQSVLVENHLQCEKDCFDFH